MSAIHHTYIKCLIIIIRKLIFIIIICMMFTVLDRPDNYVLMKWNKCIDIVVVVGKLISVIIIRNLNYLYFTLIENMVYT